ncbi:hypothetical protein J3F83DRAFT_748466 [Trichoderma novae-zelandiae]
MQYHHGLQANDIRSSHIIIIIRSSSLLLSLISIIHKAQTNRKPNTGISGASAPHPINPSQPFSLSRPVLSRYIPLVRYLTPRQLGAQPTWHLANVAHKRATLPFFSLSPLRIAPPLLLLSPSSPSFSHTNKTKQIHQAQIGSSPDEDNINKSKYLGSSPLFLFPVFSFFSSFFFLFFCH